MVKLRNSLELTRRERYEAYRNGEVETLSFDTEAYHLCYGVDELGDVFDFCLIGDTIVHIEGKLTEAELERAQKVIDEL
jgi:hypothetical protein